MDKASAPRKKPKGSATAEAARKKVMNRVLGANDKQQFADPAALFNAM